MLHNMVIILFLINSEKTTQITLYKGLPCNSTILKMLKVGLELPLKDYKYKTAHTRLDFSFLAHVAVGKLIKFPVLCTRLILISYTYC